MDWNEIDGWLYPNEAEQLMKMAEQQYVLEIGSYKGRSSVALATAATSLHCVDHFSGNPDDCLGGADPTPLRDLFLSNTKSFRNLTLYEMPFTEFAGLNDPSFYEFIFYDAGHNYDNTKAFLDWLVAGQYQGALALHDYNKPDEFPGTLAAVDEFKKNEPFDLIGSLICLAPESVAFATRSIA